MAVTVDQNVEVLRRAQQLCTALYAANHNTSFEADMQVRVAAGNMINAMFGLNDYMPSLVTGFPAQMWVFKGSGGNIVPVYTSQGSQFYPADPPTVTFWGLAGTPYAAMRGRDTVLVNDQTVPVGPVTLSGAAVGSGNLRAKATVLNNVITSLALVP